MNRNTYTSYNRLDLLRNQLSIKVKEYHKPLSDPGKEEGAIEINNTSLIAIPMVIPFDKECNPILNELEHKHNYMLMKELFMDQMVMETSSLNGGKAYNTIQEDEMNKTISLFVKHTKEEKLNPYQLYKIYDKNTNEFVSVQGVINTNLMVKDKCIVKAGGKLIVESATFVRSKYINSKTNGKPNRYGTKTIDWSVKEAKQRDEAVFASIRGDNKKCMSIAADQEMYYLGSIEIKGKLVNLYGTEIIKKTELQKVGLLASRSSELSYIE